MILMVGLIACGGSSKAKAPPKAPRPTGYPQPFHLIPLLTIDNPHLVQTADLLARTGNKREKNEAGVVLARLSDQIGSDAWRAQQLPVLQRLKPQALRIASERERWLNHWQKRYLVRVYDAMTALSSKSVLAHCREVASDESRRYAERQLALTVLAARGQTRRGGGSPTSPFSMPTGPVAASDPTKPYDTTYQGAPTGPAGDWSNPQDRSRPRQDAPRVRGGQIINVNEVVDALRPYFKACYERALAEYGRFGAWIILYAQIARDGTVSAVTGKADESVPYTMMQCLRSVVAQARFAAPVGGSALVEIPLTFTVAPTQ